MKGGPQGSRSSPSKALLQKQAKVGCSSTLLQLKDGLVLKPVFLSEQGDVQRRVADAAELRASSQTSCSLAQQRELPSNAPPLLIYPCQEFTRRSHPLLPLGGCCRG